jgi:hypothetical protein
MLLLAALALTLACTGEPQSAEKPTVDFARDILPIFKERCYECHDARKHQSGLRLDLRAGALRGGESGKAAIAAKDSGNSELLRRVLSTDETEFMPPKGDRLTPAQVKSLRDWIDAGAPWPDEFAGDDAKLRHWAFKPPVGPRLPDVSRAAGGLGRGWPRNAIDYFILARLSKENLQPSPEADRTTLIRRLSLDLIGLPPTIEEVDAFLSDQSKDAYEKVVERLLNSPHYGERWGRHWLDAARYADSDGFEKDKSRQVWFYRDWVISALNRDLPYDRFIIEQLAGDLLPRATQEQIVATGFLRNSMINEEGGVDPEQFRMEAMFDRMDAIGKGILGLTIQCAQCHDHKFDPLTQSEYYRLFAFLNNDHEANVAVYTPDEEMMRADLFRQIAAIEADLKHKHPDWRDQIRAWEEKAKSGQPEWVVLRPAVDPHTDGGQKYLPLEDGSFLAQGYAPTKHKVQMTVKTDVKDVTAFRVELLNDPNLPLGGPGRSLKGTGALTEFAVEAAPADDPKKFEKIKFVKATADVNPPETPLDPIYDDKSKKRRVTGPASFAIDGKDETAWGIDVGPGRRNQPRKAVFLAEKPISHPGGTVLRFFLTQNHGGWNSDDNQNHNLGRLRLSLTTQPDAEADPLPARVRAVLSIPPERRTAADEAAVFAYWRTTVAEWQEANDRIEALWKQYPEGSAQLVLQPREQPRATHVLKRGDFLKPTRRVTAGVPMFLHPLAAAPLAAGESRPGEGSATQPNRLTFAKWLVDRRSPTTARALVNRVWQTYFGTGLVPTSEDLGTQSEPPSHPELLDWLAVEFMERGWSLKALHRLIVGSATYRQSSKVTPALLATDPYNRLLSRGPRIRVEAEIVRDLSLAASGLLNPKVGGRSVFPPLPDWMFQPPVSYGPKIWPTEKGPERYRRALYTFRYRSVPHPFLQTFDAPNGDFACVRRARSNTPLQSLMTLNEPIAMDCAKALALNTLRDGGKTDAERIVYAFRRCVARRPTDAESAELLGLLARERERFADASSKPEELGSPGAEFPREPPEGIKPAETAAWTIVARVLLNLDEMITKE